LMKSFLAKIGSCQSAGSEIQGFARPPLHLSPDIGSDVEP